MFSRLFVAFLLFEVALSLKCYQGPSQNQTSIECGAGQSCIIMEYTHGNYSRTFFDCDETFACKRLNETSSTNFLLKCCHKDLCNSAEPGPTQETMQSSAERHFSTLFNTITLFIYCFI